MSPDRIRYARYAAIMLLGLVATLAVRNAPPGPRLSHRARLIDLIAAEDDSGRRLRGEIDALQGRLDDLEQQAARRGSSFATLQRELDALGARAGTSPARGPGVVATLRDSTMRRSPTGDPNDLVIHEQDIQAVVNALWSGGAEAMSINGERITSETAVRCVGNTLLLHGSVYSPPYVVSAIGAPDALARALATDALMQPFLIFVQDFHLGFTVDTRGALFVPGFGGPVADDFARA